MKQNIFSVGKTSLIKDVLSNKDYRVSLQSSLLKKYPDSSVVAMKLNIPGPIKNNVSLKILFDEGVKKFLLNLSYSEDIKPFKNIHLQDKTGNECFIVFDESGIMLKRVSVEFEDHFELGRLFDIDVLDNLHEGRAISRGDLGVPPRRCLICQKPAKMCARSRNHSVAELQEKINDMYWNYFN